MVKYQCMHIDFENILVAYVASLVCLKETSEEITSDPGYLQKFRVFGGKHQKVENLAL